jgi:hypothetical protein
MSQRTLSEQLVGAWSLVSYEIKTADGIVQHPLGADAVGLLIYGPNGLMTVQIMASARARWRVQSQGPRRLADLAAAAEGYLAYAGPYEVDEATRTVTHHVELSLTPQPGGPPTATSGRPAAGPPHPHRRAVTIRRRHGDAPPDLAARAVADREGACRYAPGHAE